MADLPADRLTPTPPFTYCAVDYFGPWYVNEGRKELKRCGVLFTCLVTRANYPEVANMQTWSRVPDAQRQWVNFIGTLRELKEVLAKTDQDQVKAEMLKENFDRVKVKYNFPPCQPHIWNLGAPNSNREKRAISSTAWKDLTRSI